MDKIMKWVAVALVVGGIGVFAIEANSMGEKPEEVVILAEHKDLFDLKEFQCLAEDRTFLYTRCQFQTEAWYQNSDLECLMELYDEKLKDKALRQSEIFKRLDAMESICVAYGRAK